MVVNHDLDIAQDLTVSPVGLLAGLGEAAQGLALKGAMRLGVEHKRHGQQPLDPFWVMLAGQLGRGRARGVMSECYL